MKTHAQEIKIAYSIPIVTEDGDLLRQRLFDALMKEEVVDIPRELVIDIILNVNDKALILSKYAGKESARVIVRTKTIEVIHTKAIETTQTGKIITQEIEDRSIVSDDGALAGKVLYDVLVSDDEVKIPRKLVIDLLTDSNKKDDLLAELADKDPALQAELAKMYSSSKRKSAKYKDPNKIEWGEAFE